MVASAANPASALSVASPLPDSGASVVSSVAPRPPPQALSERAAAAATRRAPTSVYLLDTTCAWQTVS